MFVNNHKDYVSGQGNSSTDDDTGDFYFILLYLDSCFQFFATSSTNFDDDLKSFETDDLDIGAMSLGIQETLETTEALINRLGEINLDLVQCLTQLEQKKTAK